MMDLVDIWYAGIQEARDDHERVVDDFFEDVTDKDGSDDSDDIVEFIREKILFLGVQVRLRILIERMKEKFM